MLKLCLGILVDTTMRAARGLSNLICADILVLVNELVVMAILMVSAYHPGYIPSDNMPTCDWSTSMTSHNIVRLVLVSVN